MCLHMKRTSAESSFSKLGKLDSPISLAPAAIRGTVGSSEDVLLPTK
jgi:hypothetical protein